ncbi:MAG: hypothetical protein KGM16_05425 [Bacteroidota bacterium]|nr:hypothetical protein [Bacteroidota bacterium]
MFENYSNEKRKNLSFHLLSAIREAMNIAKKTDPPVTYEQAFDVLFDIDPSLYSEVIKELPQRNLNETARLYMTKAKLMSAVDFETTAVDEIQKEIDANEILLQRTVNLEEDKKPIQNRQLTLIAAKKSLEDRKVHEHRILQRDFSKINRKDFGAEFIEEDDFKVDYLLGKDSFLRLRLLHPDNMEAVTGADLVYEQQDLASRKIRVMFLQYKIWDENGVMYFSQGNLEGQLRKLKANLCEKGFCAQPVSLNSELDYRFPYCICFLRPTDPIQDGNSKLISSGIHIPVCAALKIKDEGETKLDKRYLRTQTLTHKMFEPLFNKSFVGSRWLNENELKAFYLDNNIIQANESILIYGREMIEEEDDPPF